MFLQVSVCPLGGVCPGPGPRGCVQAEAWGDVQAQTWGGFAQEGCPGPGLGGVQAWARGGVQTQAQRWGVYPSMHLGRHPSSRRLLLQMVRILLECIQGLGRKPIIWPNISRSLHENQRNWTGGWGTFP